MALTRLPKLAELLQAGTLSSGAFSSLTNSGGGKYRPKDLETSLDFLLDFTVPLGHVLYQDANFVVETLPSSQLDLNATLHLDANFEWFKLTAIQAQINGRASFELDVHARAALAKSLENSIPLITPVHSVYGGFIGPVPVWVDVVLEVEAGYTADFSTSADITTGIGALKTISVGRKWDVVNGWQPIFDNPPVSLTLLGPTWQVERSADIRAYLQPKVSLLIYSLAGVAADLEPYLELSGSAQLSPPQWDLGLYAGLDSTIGLDLSVWDDSLGDLPSMTLNLIPRQTLWHASGPPSQPTAPQITAQPQSQTASLGSTVSFYVQAQGSAPLSYCWYKNGLPLTDDTCVAGSRSSALRIASIQSSDAGNYTVRVSNQAGSMSSGGAIVTVLGAAPVGMGLIPAGSFTMGNCMDPSEGDPNELPLHTAYVSAFYMDKFLVTKSLWDTVYQWAIAHGYTFDYGGSGKASTHPVQRIDWYDCVKWCNARSEKEGRVPAYYTDAGLSVRYRTGQLVALYVNWSSGYRLPTEAEWEKAARGGASGHRFPWSDADTINWSRANYSVYRTGATNNYAYDVNATSGYNPAWTSGGQPYTTAVGTFAANGYGLYDMAGNVHQWCWDWFGGTYYGSSSPTDPRGPLAGSYRVGRGGGWGSNAFNCRAAGRNGSYPAVRNSRVGFRCARAAGQ